MKVLVCGGRDFTDYNTTEKVLNHLNKQRPITCIVSGHARGADTLGEQWASENDVPVSLYPADWKTHGKSAGPIRNLEMLRNESPDLVVAMPGGRGTNHMVQVSREHKTPVVSVLLGTEGYTIELSNI